MKRILGFLMALMICLGVFTLVGEVNTVKAATTGTWGTAMYELDDENNLVFTGSGAITNTWPSELSKSNIVSIKCSNGVTIALPTNSAGLFRNMTHLASFEGYGFDTSNVTSFEYLFYMCINLKHVDLSTWDVRNVTNMHLAFSQCGLTSIDLSNWKTSSLTNIQQIFNINPGLKNINVTGWDTSHVTNMKLAFYQVGATDLDLSTWDTSNATDMGRIFEQSNDLKSLDISSWNTNNATTLETIFSDCVQLREIKLGPNFNFKGNDITNVYFQGIMRIPPSDSQYTGKWIREDGKYGPYTPAELRDNYTSEMAGTWVWEKKPPEAYAILQDNGELVFFRADAGLTAGAGKTVTDVSGNTYTGQLYTGIETRSGSDALNCAWFSRRYEIKSVRVADGQVIKPINCYYWFYDCSNMKSCDLTGLDTSNVTNMGVMFCRCSGLVSLDVSNFNTNKVTNMSEMFSGCSSLTSLDLSTFNTSKVTTMQRMFGDCSSLISLNLSSFDTSKVTNSQNMFSGSKNLKSVNLGDKFDFAGNNISWTQQPLLPKPTGSEYSGKWIRDDKAFGPYTPAELRDNYTSEMAGKWVWELAPTEYTISFAAGENGTGSMAPVNAPSKEDFTLPANQFMAFGYEFDHWDDGNGKTYADKGTISANTYQADQKVTLTAVWKKRDTSLNWDDNEAEFSIRAGEQAVLDNIPAGTSYQVYELTPDGWVLVQQENASGVIEALEESSAAFWNKYQPGVTTVQFSGLKNLDGRPAEAGKFTFELYEGETLVDTATTQDGGFIQFKVIEYDAAGDHVYTIREVDPNDDTIDYDTHEETVEVSVTDNGDGTLSSEVTYDDDGIVFSNTTRPGTLRITKDANNGTSANENDEFTIEIEFRNESGMPINDDIYWYVEGGATTPSEISGDNQE